MARTLAGISPRDDFAAVFSRVLGALFIIGGRPPQSNNYTGEIWMVAENKPPILLNIPGYQPEYVTAATIGTVDQMLWILDHGYRPTWGPSRRLVRINLNAASLEYETVHEGPMTYNYDTYWLSTDHDGQVLLTASHWLGNYATMRIEANPYGMGVMGVTGTHQGTGTIMMPPIVDAEGYQFMIRDWQGTVEPLRVQELVHPGPNGVYLGLYM
jgi:hypothetical protein